MCSGHALRSEWPFIIIIISALGECNLWSKCVRLNAVWLMNAMPLQVLLADHDGEGGTFALYSSICRHVGISPARPKMETVLEDRDVAPRSIWTSASNGCFSSMTTR